MPIFFMISLRINFVKIYLIIIFNSLVFVNWVNAQPITELRVIGNSASFYFNTIEQYQNGVTLTDWSTIRVRYQITGKTAWQIIAWTDYSDIEHEDGTNSIPLNNFTIEINTLSISSANTTTIYTTPFAPTTTPTPLLWGIGNVGVDATVEFKISYKISPAGLGSLPSGTYYLPLNLRLEEQ